MTKFFNYSLVEHSMHVFVLKNTINHTNLTTLVSIESKEEKTEIMLKKMLMLNPLLQTYQQQYYEK